MAKRRPSRIEFVAVMMVLSAALAGVRALAQSQPQFEIADVHVSSPTPAVVSTPTMQGGVVRSGIYRIQTATMVDLIRTAYAVDADTVVGGPSWLEWDRFDVLAKVPPSTSPDTLRLMLQSLLADRFALVIHRDTRPLPRLALTVRRGGTAKLKASDGSGDARCVATAQPPLTDPSTAPRTFVYACRNTSMAAFAAGLSSMAGAQEYLDRGTVVDQTALNGRWDFEFRFSQKPLFGGPSGTERVTLADALATQLGLTLQSVAVPTPVLVVDRVNRTPGDNPADVSAVLGAPPPPAFEAAALRLSDPNAPDVRSPGPMPGGRFEVLKFSLRQLIQVAWGVSGSMIGAPEWLEAIRIDLIAKLPPTPSTRELEGLIDFNMFQPALKTLLTERFKVAIHTEQRPGDGYGLVAAKPRLRKSNPATRTKCVEGPGPDGKDPRTSNPLLSRLVACQNITMGEFAEQLPRLSRGAIRGTVVDASGITGRYDLTISFSGPEVARRAAVEAQAGERSAASDPGGRVTLEAALERQLGLRLEKRTVPVPVVVLDYVEAKPTEN